MGALPVSLDEAVELKARGHCVRLFRGLFETIIGECLTVERVGDVEDPSLVSASTTPSQSSAGQSSSVAWVKRSFVMDYGLFFF